MVGQIVLTYQRRRFSSRKNGPNVSPPLEISVSKSSSDSNKHLAQNMTRECEISCVQSEAKVKENLLECENGPTQFHAEHIIHDKITQCAESLEATVKSSGQEEISERNEASASGTNNRWSSRLITYRRRSMQNNKKSVPDAEEALISKKIKVDGHPCIIAELDLSAAVQIVQNPVTCEARESVIQRDVQDNDHTNCLSVKPRGLPIDNQNQMGSLCTTASCNVVYNQPLHCGSEVNNLTRTSGVHLSIGLINEMTKMHGDFFPRLVHDFSFVYQAGAVGDEGKELADSGKSNHLQLFPESRSNNTTVRVNGSQKDAAFTCPQDRWCQFKPATMQSSSPYNVLEQQQMINAYASSPSLYNWPSLYIKSRDAFHNFLHHSWDPAPERPGNHNLMSSLPATWTDVELDSLWVGVRRHGRGNWEMMLRDLKLQFLPGKTPQDLAERWGEEYSHLLYSRRGYQSSGPVDLLCRRVGTHLCERNEQLQYPVANTATISPYSYFRNSSMGLFNPYGGNGMPQVDSWSGAGQVNCTREAALLAPRPSRTRPVVPPACCLGTSQQPGSNNNSFDCIARQAEFQTHMRACSENPPPVTGHLNVGTSEHSGNKDLIVLPGGAPSEKTISDDVSNEH